MQREGSIECQGRTGPELVNLGWRFSRTGRRPWDYDKSDSPDWPMIEVAVDGDKVGVSLEAKIIQELGCRRAAGLQILGFVKYMAWWQAFTILEVRLR
jgi:hypothetical protein